MSFFDEDDEPQRTTARTRAQPKPRPRSGRPTGGGSSDAQNVAVRRMVAVVVGLLVLILLFVVVRACNDRRHENALKDYNLQVGGIATQSRQTGEELFKALSARRRPVARRTSTRRSTASRHRRGVAQAGAGAERARATCRDAQQSLLISLMLRRDALGKVASDIRPALGDAGDAADRAIKAIAGQNQAFNASDVLYQSRVVPFIKNALKDAEHHRRGPELPVHERDLLGLGPPTSPPSSASSSPPAPSTGNGNTTNSKTPTGPGLHGTGLNGTSYGNTTLQPGASNRLVYAAGQAFTVSFTNQGDNDEFNIKVTLKIARTSGGDPLTLTKTVPRATKGEKVTVTLPLNRTPAAGHGAERSRSNVAAVPRREEDRQQQVVVPVAVRAGLASRAVSDFSDAPARRRARRGGGGVVGAGLAARPEPALPAGAQRAAARARRARADRPGRARRARCSARSRRCTPASTRSREHLAERMAAAEDRLDGAIAYRALVRYDAYNEMSGHQSTTIALLDADHNGVVLSSIAHRDTARLYCKQVHGGRGEQQLSPEEEEAVRLALAGEVGSVILSEQHS